MLREGGYAMKVVCLIQARRNSYRLQNKVMEKIGSRTMLQHVVERCQAIAQRFPVYVITPPQDRNLHPLAIAPDCPEGDLLKRHLLAAKELDAGAVLRITSDCPFVDPDIARDVLDLFLGGKYDYVANDVEPTYPDGLGVEIMTTEALDYADRHLPPALEYDRTHVSPWVKYGVRSFNGPKGISKRFDGRNLRCPVPSLQNIKLSIDTPKELALARAIWGTGVLPDNTIRPMVHTLVAYRRVMDTMEYDETTQTFK